MVGEGRDRSLLLARLNQLLGDREAPQAGYALFAPWPVFGGGHDVTRVHLRRIGSVSYTHLDVYKRQV